MVEGVDYKFHKILPPPNSQGIDEEAGRGPITAAPGNIMGDSQAYP